MKFVCDVCGLTYGLTNEDTLKDARVNPHDVVVPTQVIHKCAKRDKKWYVMKKVGHADN